MQVKIELLQDRIKFLREDRDLNQVAFGNKIGVKKSTVSGYESGRRTPNEAVLKSICREFNVSRAWLENGIGDIYNNMDIDLLNKVDEIISGEDEFYKNLLRTIVNLSDEDLLLFKKMVDNLTKKS